MINKELYKKFCDSEPIPIFSQYWWLDSVCGSDGWDVLLVVKGNDIWASMPYYKTKRGFFDIITMPTLTQNMGIYVKYPQNQKSHKKISWENEMTKKLFDKLPKFDSYLCNFHYNVSNWMELYWNNFNCTTHYTYVINDLDNLDEVYNNFDKSYRNKIANAKKKVEVKTGMNISDFFDINKMTFERQNIDIPYSLNFLEKHDYALAKNNAREIFYAVDELNNIHSALYLTWDKKSSYVHMVGEDPELRNSAAGLLLIWEAIKYTKEVLGLNIFDFEGSMLKNVEQVRRKFGATQTQYFSISKVNSKTIKFKNFFKDIVK
ncbi:GNAT family N-acetyltransferase [Sulfurimonas lithotrophica]|nr:GNAT family N-acetyltransferase [Sulfurimonas lithotrophica]